MKHQVTGGRFHTLVAIMGNKVILINVSVSKTSYIITADMSAQIMLYYAKQLTKENAFSLQR